MSFRLKTLVEISQSPNQMSSKQHLLKYTSLLVLTLQNAGQALLIRYAKTRQVEHMFLSTTAVFWCEIVKLITCTLIISLNERSLFKCLSDMYRLIVHQPLDTLKVCVPSIIYTVQNNLLYVAVANLEATTFMVTYQLKILTTALCSVTMLPNRRLSGLQWFALLLLFTGVSIVQIREQSSKETSNAGSTAATTDTGRPIVGLTAALIAVFLSGFAGVYFERILKSQSAISVWARNIQLSVLSIPIAAVTMFATDGTIIRQHGLLYGYDEVVWACVMLYALGGLCVAVVVKYADNILKGFSTSISIILSCIVSMYLFDFHPDIIFLLGTAVVIAAVIIYGSYPPKPVVQSSAVQDVLLGENERRLAA